jgi:hypothetical protein
MKAKIQRAKVGVAGSLINQLLSNNMTLPQVGKGATELLYTDRRCYEVVDVSKDGKTVKLEFLNAIPNRICDDLEMGHQNWELIPTNNFITITWRHGAWKTISKNVILTDEFIQKCNDDGIKNGWTWIRINKPEIHNKIYDGHIYPINAVEGYTKEKKVYNKIQIIFGVKDFYYDWEF